MKINQDHLYHGAALTQIAEHEQFTAINAVRVDGSAHRSAFRINDSACVFLKYATKPRPPYDEYTFTFNASHMDDLEVLRNKGDKIYLALVCVEDSEICLLPYNEFLGLVDKRKNLKKAGESQYTVLVILKPGGKFRVNVNKPGKRGYYIGDPILIARKDFPERLFSG